MSILFDMKIDLQDGNGDILHRFYCGIVSVQSDCQVFDAKTKDRLCGKIPNAVRQKIISKAKYWLQR